MEDFNELRGTYVGEAALELEVPVPEVVAVAGGFDYMQVSMLMCDLNPMICPGGSH